jgi:hypothetical protein
LKAGISKLYSQCNTIESGLFFVGDIKGAFSDTDQGYSGMILALQYNESSCLQLAFRLPVQEYNLLGAAFRIKWGDSWSKWFRFNYI